MKKIVLLGGSGFVGSHIVHRLSAQGYQVKVLARRREDAKHLILLPGVQVEECDVFVESALSDAIHGCDAVINLIGILHEYGRNTFERIHAELPRRVAEACRAQGVPRLLHMSALQAGPDAPSAYLRSKAAGEAAVREGSTDALKVTIFRPSVIFGRGDSFINLFARLVSTLPVIVLAKPNARFQPVFVEDVAQAFVASLELADTVGQHYALCGPKVYTLRELVQAVADTLGLKRWIIGLNDPLSMLQAGVMEWLPVKLMTRDNIRSMQVDSVCECPFPPVFRLVPTPLEAVVPTYLGEARLHETYIRFRRTAGR